MTLLKHKVQTYDLLSCDNSDFGAHDFHFRYVPKLFLVSVAICPLLICCYFFFVLVLALSAKICFCSHYFCPHIFCAMVIPSFNLNLLKQRTFFQSPCRTHFILISIAIFLHPSAILTSFLNRIIHRIQILGGYCYFHGLKSSCGQLVFLCRISDEIQLSF